MTMTGLPTPVRLVVGQANEIGTVALTEFLSSYITLSIHEKQSVLLSKQLLLLSVYCLVVLKDRVLTLPNTGHKQGSLFKTTQRRHIVCSNAEYQSTGYEETLRSCKGLSRGHLSKFHPPFWFGNWRESESWSCDHVLYTN